MEAARLKYLPSVDVFEACTALSLKNLKYAIMQTIMTQTAAIADMIKKLSRETMEEPKSDECLFTPQESRYKSPPPLFQK